KLVALGVGIDKIEEFEIALSVPDHAVEIVDLKQAQVAVVILNAFLLELGALFRGEVVSLTLGLGPGGPELMISQQRFATVGAHSVGTAVEFHLEDAEVDPELQFVPAVEAENFANFDGALFMRPILENGVEVEAHPEKMIEHLVFNCQSLRVSPGDV